MKYIRFQSGVEIHYGILEQDTIQKLEGDMFGKYTLTGETFSLSQVKILPPCLPSKIVAVGLNYSAHAEEMKDTVPDFPALFLKPSTAVVGQDDAIVYPAMSHQVDYEAELAAVIKKTAHHVPREAAEEYIFGYTCCNDVTARDLQRADVQWMRAKSFDTFAPLGPVIETELDPNHLTVQSFLNGELRQDSNTENFIFPVDYLVSVISQIMTLYPGDVITTGTPAGIGSMQPGDTIEVKIEGIGTLRNHVVK